MNPDSVMAINKVKLVSRISSAQPGIITLSVVSANTPNICKTPRDTLTKPRIEPNKRHSADPRADLQRFSSLKGEPSASKGNSKCGECTKITSVRFGVLRLLPDVALLGALT
jgi:hypothetical protein